MEFIPTYVTTFTKRDLMAMCNCNYYFKILISIYFTIREWTELFVCISLLIYTIVTQGNSLYLLYIKWVSELPAILDSLFHGLVSITSVSVGVKSHEVVDSFSFKNLTLPNCLTWSLLVLWLSQIDAKSIVNIASEPYGDFQQVDYVSSILRAI